MNKNPEIHLLNLTDDAVSKAIAQRHQVLSPKEFEGVMGGQDYNREFSEWMNSKKLIPRPVIK